MYHGTVAEQNGLDIAIRALALARRVVPELQLHIQATGHSQVASSVTNINHARAFTTLLQPGNQPNFY
jgi:hypothetical protein